MTRRIVCAIVIVVMIVGIAVIIAVTMSPGPTPQSSPATQRGSAMPDPDAFVGHDVKESIIAGDDDAPLTIEACLPIGADCHKTTPAFLAKLAKNHPKLIHVEVADMYGPDGKRILDKYKAGCSMIFFNGESILKLKKESGEEEVYFTGPLDAGYTLKDIALAAQQILRKLKGDTIEIPDLTVYVNEAKSGDE